MCVGELTEDTPLPPHPMGLTCCELAWSECHFLSIEHWSSASRHLGKGNMAAPVDGQKVSEGKDSLKMDTGMRNRINHSEELDYSGVSI